MEDTTLLIGSVSASVLLSIILAIIYSCISVPVRFQPLIAVLTGIGIGLIVMLVQEISFDVKNVVEYCVRGLMTGATAIGLHQVKNKVMKPPEIK